ncbi:MAG: NAD(P)-dependent oxidoreductase [Candidatus Margulisiibacteriota bacterium]
MKSNVFITGITGCVGHYVFDLLVKNPEYELYLLVRDPQRLKRDLSKYPNVKIIQDDLSNIKKHEELLKQMDCVMHAAAGWGNSETNYDYTLDLLESLNPDRIKKIIYFSTASILDSNNRPMQQAEQFGTCYIESKYRMFKKLPELPVYNKIITLFPTWVLGGDADHPYSHAMEGIVGAGKWLWLLRFFSFELSFHFIHAADIALIVDYLLGNDGAKKEYVLGNALISADELINEICAYHHKKIYFRLRISAEFVKAAAALSRKNLNEWDRYCLDKKKFQHQVVSAESFGLASQNKTIPNILKNLAL